MGHHLVPFSYNFNLYWLVVWNIFYFCIYWEFRHPNWLRFFRGVAQPPSNIFTEMSTPAELCCWRHPRKITWTACGKWGSKWACKLRLHSYRPILVNSRCMYDANMSQVCVNHRVSKLRGMGLFGIKLLFCRVWISHKLECTPEFYMPLLQACGNLSHEMCVSPVDTILGETTTGAFPQMFGSSTTPFQYDGSIDTW